MMITLLQCSAGHLLTQLHARTAHKTQAQSLGIFIKEEHQEEQEVVRHLFQRLALVLMRGNAQLLVNRMPPEDLPDAEVDGCM